MATNLAKDGNLKKVFPYIHHSDFHQFSPLPPMDWAVFFAGGNASLAALSCSQVHFHHPALQDRSLMNVE